MRRLVFFFPLLLVISCRRDDEIQTYRVSKEEIPAMPIAAGMAAGGAPAPAATSRAIDWKVPAGWQEQTPSAMRVGSFLIKGSNGQTADVSVIPLSGEAGGDLANINRWRAQINLGPISKADLSAQSETIKPAGRKMLYIDFVSHDLLIGHRYKKRLMAAIYQQKEQSWFFKITGEDTTVLSAKSAFLQFLKSLQFHDS